MASSEAEELGITEPSIPEDFPAAVPSASPPSEAAEPIDSHQSNAETQAEPAPGTESQNVQEDSSPVAAPREDLDELLVNLVDKVGSVKRRNAELESEVKELKSENNSLERENSRLRNRFESEVKQLKVWLKTQEDQKYHKLLKEQSENEDAVRSLERENSRLRNRFAQACSNFRGLEDSDRLIIESLKKTANTRVPCYGLFGLVVSLVSDWLHMGTLRSLLDGRRDEILEMQRVLEEELTMDPTSNEDSI